MFMLQGAERVFGLQRCSSPCQAQLLPHKQGWELLECLPGPKQAQHTCMEQMSWEQSQWSVAGGRPLGGGEGLRERVVALRIAKGLQQRVCVKGGKFGGWKEVEF